MKREIPSLHELDSLCFMFSSVDLCDRFVAFELNFIMTYQDSIAVH